MRVHSWLSERCCIQASNLGGSGVFTRCNLEPHELVAVWGGQILSEDEIAKMQEAFPALEAKSIRVAPGFRLASSSLFARDDAEMFNHSCDPNLGMVGSLMIVTRKAVPEGAELTVDYETIDDVPNSFECRCKSPDCRESISGEAWKDAAFRQQHCGYLSSYIEWLIRTSNCNDKTYVSETRLGKGLFTAVALRPGEVAFRFAGPIISLADAIAMGEPRR
ncbi:MAG: SET domain-containing protein-lysine N-methyltransferase [Pirellulaceae bacterium]